jgi:hypothetical protein
MFKKKLKRCLQEVQDTNIIFADQLWIEESILMS